MWEIKWEIFVNNYDIDRSKDSISCKCNSNPQKCHHWIYYRELVDTKQASGRTLEESGNQVMNIYCKRRGGNLYTDYSSLRRRFVFSTLSRATVYVAGKHIF